MKHWLIRDRWLADLALLWGLGPDPGKISCLARHLGMQVLIRTPLWILRQALGLRVSLQLLGSLGPLSFREARLVEEITRGERDYRDLRLARFLPLVPGPRARLRVLRDTLLPTPKEARERHGAEAYLPFLGHRLLRALGLGDAE
jgi:hypothetical protein